MQNIYETLGMASVARVPSVREAATASLLYYTLQQAKCENKGILTPLKQHGFEILKMSIILFLIFRVTSYLIYDVGGPDLRTKGKRVYEVLEALVLLLVGVSLLVKYDTTLRFMEALSPPHLIWSLIASTTVLAGCLLIIYDMKHVRTIAIVSLSIILALLISLAGVTMFGYPKGLKGHFVWRGRIPDFTDIFFISIAAWLVIYDGIKKLRGEAADPKDKATKAKVAKPQVKGEPRAKN